MSLGKQVYELYHQKPFRPFRLHLKDGKHYDVRQRWNNVVGMNMVALGIPRADDPDPYPIAQYSVEIRAEQIARVELLAELGVPGGKD